MRLLIAEDDLTSRTILESVARKWGYDTIAVEDGQAAWEVLQQDDAPRLILLDWEMPEMDGLEVCQHVREQDSNDPPYIILLSARTETNDIVEGLNVGANDYIVKPFSNAELQARLQAGRRMLELQDELRQAKEIMADERRVIENILLTMRASGDFDADNLRQLQTPVEKTSGDILLSATRSDGIQHVMLGDFTGHGLTAAIGSPIVSDTFYTMTSKDLPMHTIAVEINRHMCEKMPTGLFLAAVFIELDPVEKKFTIWNCGMEDVLYFKHDKLERKIASSCLALGITDMPFDKEIVIEADAGDRIYAYSDGITEANNGDGEEFGLDRLVHAISAMLAMTETADIDLLCSTVQEFLDGAEQLDDITLVELSC